MSQANATEAHLKKAIFAGGCFWCTEAAFDYVDGVVETTSGYIGGKTPNPTYEQVSTGQTGHIEALQVTYDPEKVTYPELLITFWQNIDPTDEGGQFYDRGKQYSTVIFYMDEAQKKFAEESKYEVEARLGTSVATDIREASTFYPAETYHQDYHKKNPRAYQRYKDASGRENTLKEIWQKP